MRQSTRRQGANSRTSIDARTGARARGGRSVYAWRTRRGETTARRGERSSGAGGGRGTGRECLWRGGGRARRVSPGPAPSRDVSGATARDGSAAGESAARAGGEAGGSH